MECGSKHWKTLQSGRGTTQGGKPASPTAEAPVCDAEGSPSSQDVACPKISCVRGVSEARTHYSVDSSPVHH